MALRRCVLAMPRLCLPGAKVEPASPMAAWRQAAQSKANRRQVAVQAFWSLDSRSRRSHIDSLKRAYAGAPAQCSFDIVGLGQAMCDFSGRVEQAFLDTQRLPLGSRRCGRSALLPPAVPGTWLLPVLPAGNGRKRHLLGSICNSQSYLMEQHHFVCGRQFLAGETCMPKSA